MTGPSHLVVGIVSSVYLGYSAPAQLVVVGVSSLLPDIDRKQGLFGRMIPILPSLLENTFGKRTITHSLLFMGAMSLLAMMIYPSGLIPFLIGFLSHIVLDLFTGKVMFLFPYPKYFNLVFGIPPVFIETFSMIGLGVFMAFNWNDFMTRIPWI